MEDELKWKMTYNGRRPRNIKSRISQQQLFGSYSNTNALNEDYLQWKAAFNGRRPPMEDNLNKQKSGISQ
jgi:hypothetical protein